MKKIWLVVLLVLGVLTVSGCQAQLDEVDQNVDRAIDQFIENYVTTYIEEDYVNDYVLASIYHLDPEDKEKILSENLNPNMLLVRDTAYGLISALVYESIVNKDMTESRNILLTKTTENSYEAPSLLHAAYMANGSVNQINAYIDVIINTDPTSMDADYAGMAMLALSPYQDQEGVLEYIEDLKALILGYLSKDGVISWGNANSATTATVIIGLVAIGENPRSEVYTVEDIDLIEALLSYENEGGFKWMHADEDLDLMFSTPQAFTALTLYQLFRKGQKPIYLYDFSK
ncbi:MAG: hypothetical protein WC245_08355 [Bacteroidales bacterium]